MIKYCKSRFAFYFFLTLSTKSHSHLQLIELLLTEERRRWDAVKSSGKISLVTLEFSYLIKYAVSVLRSRVNLNSAKELDRSQWFKCSLSRFYMKLFFFQHAVLRQGELRLWHLSCHQKPGAIQQKGQLIILWAFYRTFVEILK